MPLRGDLPAPRDADGDFDWLECPWCKADASDASLRLGDLLNAHTHDALHLADITRTGEAGATALTCDCPSCGKPFVVTLRKWRCWPLSWRWLRLFPVRTAKDVAFRRHFTTTLEKERS